jgi:hypothetical protein
MQPSIALRLENVLKALREVVLPAIDPADALAREQAQLALGHLALIAEQWPRAREFDQQSLAGLGALAELLAASAAGGARTEQAAAALRTELGRPAAVAKLGAAVDRLIEAAFADGSADFRALLDEAVLEHAARQAWRERVWFQGTGLDVDRGELPPIATLFRRD